MQNQHARLLNVVFLKALYYTPILFLLNINDLSNISNSDMLDQSIYYMYGVRISNLPYSTCCPAYADDVAIVSLHKPNLQKLLDILFEHSCSWRYCFNPKKSHVLIFGGSLSIHGFIHWCSETKYCCCRQAPWRPLWQQIELPWIMTFKHL